MEQHDLLFGMDIRLGDNSGGGKLIHLVTDREGRRVSSIVVERGLPIINREARVVPVHQIQGTHESELRLSLPAEQLGNCPEYKETTVEGEDRGVASGTPVSRAGSESASAAAVRKRVRVGVAEDDLLLSRQTKVETINQAIGNLERVLVEREDGFITHLVLRRGFLNAEHLTVPVTLVESFGESSILIGTSVDQVEELSRVTT